MSTNQEERLCIVCNEVVLSPASSKSICDSCKEEIRNKQKSEKLKQDFVEEQSPEEDELCIACRENPKLVTDQEENTGFLLCGLCLQGLIEDFVIKSKEVSEPLGINAGLLKDPENQDALPMIIIEFSREVPFLVFSTEEARNFGGSLIALANKAVKQQEQEEKPGLVVPSKKIYIPE
jgi:hypothetical protein